MDAFEQYDAINAMLRREGDERWIIAANSLARMMESEATFLTWEESREFVCAHFYWLLDNGMAREAAVLAWGFQKFNPYPQFVQDIERGINENHHLLIQGASGCSKSFYITMRLLLEWTRDPQYTTIRVASMSQAHLQDNLFSHLLDLYLSSVIPFPGESDKNLFIGLNPKVGYGCIRGITFPKDEKTTGRFLGFKMQNRVTVHPKFGSMSRIFVFLDEFNKMTPGVMGDLNSIESQIYDIDHVKIIAAYNPSDDTHIAHEVSEPKGGWSSVDPERDFQWDTKWNWHLLRLDGMQCENVREKKVIYKGFLTYPAFMGYLSKGDSSADYWTYGRGWWPLRGAFNAIFNRDILQKCRNRPIFERDVIEGGTVDAAMIQDGTVFTWFRYGPALGYILPDGTRKNFSGGNRRYICSVEQQIKIPGCADEWELAQAIRDICQSLGITAEWLALDATQSPALKNNLLRLMGGVLGLVWSESATERKVLADDTEGADKSYHNLSSEMWFATKMWIQAGIMFISPAVSESPLFNQLTSRRRHKTDHSSGKIQIESKHSYVARGHNSPDEADSLVQISQLIRTRHAVIPGRESDSNAEEPSEQPSTYFDRIPGMPGRTANKYQTVDDQVSIDEIGESDDIDPEAQYGQTDEVEEDEEAEISWQ